MRFRRSASADPARTDATPASPPGSRGCQAPAGGAGESIDDLMVQIAEGSETALARLYDLTAGLVLAMAGTAVSSEPSAEAYLTRAYRAVWKAAPRYRPGPHALAWVLHRAVAVQP